jgi:hypothetical protein
MMLLSIPVRIQHSRDYQNMILAWACNRQAHAYCRQAHDGDDDYSKEVGTSSDDEHIVLSMSIRNLSQNARALRMPAVIICNSYCEQQQREPFFEVFII